MQESANREAQLFAREPQLGTTALTARMRSLSLWIFVVLIASFTFLDYWAYSKEYYQNPHTYDLLIEGKALAPAQYRVGITFAALALHKVAHLGFRHAFTVFDFCFALGAAWALRSVLAGTIAFRSATLGSRWLRLLLLSLVFSFYLGWTTWYQRPETLACAFYVAFSLFLLHRRPLGPLPMVALVALAALQGFVRADVAILFHLGVFLVVLVRGSRDFAASRTALLLTSFLGCLLPTAILYVLMHRIYPHATYGDTAVFQLRNNLHFNMLLPFALFIVPVAYTYWRSLRGTTRLPGQQASVVLASVFYLISWALVGRMREARIFLPFAMALMPLTANLLAGEVEREDV